MLDFLAELPKSVKIWKVKIQKLMALFLFAMVSTSTHADFVATGKVTKFHMSGNNFAIFLSSTRGCPSNWYYVYKNDLGIVAWKMMFDLALSVYENGRTLSIFHTTSDCNEKRFTAIDTVN
uniref:Uncharacterized protein n=1 Tax=Candidatus Kentrum sp. SD TaxID=2126332 RepID=A0A450Y6L9_9GAMM|nr:MAG: hypothetical protein BECKSD772F_GA0070984_101212 [Candidatus Kentron sp. SD]